MYKGLPETIFHESNNLENTCLEVLLMVELRFESQNGNILSSLDSTSSLVHPGTQV